MQTTITKEVDLLATYLKAKNYSPRTVEQYCSILKRFLRYFRSTPTRISADEIVKYLCEFKERNTMAQVRGALLNYYTHVVGQPNKFDRIPHPKKDRKLPQIMSQQVVIERIRSIDNLKHRMIVSVLYGSGIRLNELLNLRLTDIDGNRNTLFVRHGKGGKDRVVPVSSKLIADLREYYRQYLPKEYLFEGQHGGRYTGTSVQAICKKHLSCNPHKLRHCNLTHLIESGVHISEVSKRAGHSKIDTTMTYNHIATTFNPITITA